MSDKKQQQPLPSGGGSFVRQADGSLTREDTSKPSKKAVEKSSKQPSKGE